MSLPLPWVDRIFEKLTLVYGRPFLDRWRDIDLERVKNDWATELSGFERAPNAIAYALQSLPDGRAPSVLDFRAICRAAPATEAPKLPAPAADPARIAAELAKLRVPTAPANPYGAKAWAHALRTRHQAGERLNPNQIRCYENALRGA